MRMNVKRSKITLKNTQNQSQIGYGRGLLQVAGRGLSPVVGFCPARVKIVKYCVDGRVFCPGRKFYPRHITRIVGVLPPAVGCCSGCAEVFVFSIFAPFTPFLACIHQKLLREAPNLIREGNGGKLHILYAKNIIKKNFDVINI